MGTNETKQGLVVLAFLKTFLLRTGRSSFLYRSKSTYARVCGTDFGLRVVYLYYQSTLLIGCGSGAPDLATSFYICYDFSSRPPLLMKVAGCGKGKVLTQEEFIEIKKHIHYKYQVFFDIMWEVGARVSEVCKLRFVDVVNGTLVIRKTNTKTKETREIPISPDLVKKIDKLPKENGFMFAGMGGNSHITRYTIDKVLRNACKECGLEGVSTHSFRRTTITELSRNNVSLRVIQKISGHRNLNVLQGYVDVDEKEVMYALRTRW